MVNLFPNATPGLLKEWTDIHRFLWAGCAVFTLVSGKTGTRYTYRIRVPKNNKNPSGIGPYFVSLLNGPNDYAYMGMVTKQRDNYVATQASRMGAEAPSAIALRWFLARAAQGGEPCGALQFWHEGHCGRCGRKLTVPESVAAGIGPECAGRMGA